MSSTLLESESVRQYVAQMKTEIAAVIDKTYTLPRSFDIGEPELRRSLHLEASALACHWVQAFSEATPEMLMWAKLFSTHLMQQSEAAAAFREIGHPNEAQSFFTNRMNYYRENNAGWQLDENLFTSWVGAVNFCSLLRSMKAPPLMGSGQKSEFLMQHKGDDLRSLHSTLGIDPMSAEYLDMMGDWLKDFTETLAKIITESNSAYLSALNSVKEEDASAINTMKAYKAICIVLALWCVVLPFMDFDQVWIYQITRIAVTIVAVFLAIVLRGWQKVVAILVGILFNPLIPIDFDRQAWFVVDVATAIFLVVVGFWPSPHYEPKKPNKAEMATPRKPSDQI